MPENEIQFELSPKAFQELKEITEEEFGPNMSDEEIAAMGQRLLRFFQILTTEPHVAPATVPKLTEIEMVALKYLHRSISHEKRQPTVRGLSEAIGKRSSRSGLRMMDQLIAKGLISRDVSGKIVMREDVAGCCSAFSC